MNILNIILIIFITMLPIKTYAYEAAFSAKDVKKQISSFNGGKNTIILLDVDDTIITPESLTFRTTPHNKIIDDIKTNRNKYQNYKEIVSNWRIQRKAMLIDPAWPDVLNELKNTYNVFGLTKVNTGSFGNIESMEKWRYEELKSLNITFSNHEAQPFSKDNQPSFFKGIMMTGDANKRDTLKKYIATISPVDAIIFIDDRKKNLQEIKEFCAENHIKFLGIHYLGLENIKGKQDEEVYLLPKNTLINEAKWLSDQEAREQTRIK